MSSIVNLASSQGGDDIAREMRTALYASWNYDRENRREALEDLRFVAGFQWSDAARALRANRPTLTINRSVQFLRQVSNPLRGNVPTIKTVPVDSKSDPVISDIFNGLLRQIQYQSSAAHIYASTVEHTVACGIGWFRLCTDFVDDEGFDQELNIKRISNPLSVYPDPGANEFTKEDMMHCIVSEMIPRDAFLKKYPSASAASMDAPLDVGMQSAPVWNFTDMVRIGEYWKREEVRAKRILLRSGIVVDPAVFPEWMIRRIGVIRERDVITHKVTMTKCSGVEQLEETQQWVGTYIPLIPVIGSEIPLEKGVYRHGLIRFQREPQQMQNLLMSTAVETVGMAPKAPVTATQPMIGPYKAMWDNANTVQRPYLLYEPDPRFPNLRPERLAPPEVPQALIGLAQMFIDAEKGVTGVYDAQTGARSNETSGIAIQSRVAQGDNANAHFVDNLEHALELAGRQMIEIIPKVYDTSRTIRIVGEDDVEKWAQINAVMYHVNGLPMIVNDLSTARFDCHVDIGRNFQSKRLEAIDILTRFMQAFPPAAAVIGDILAKNLDVDFAEQLAARLKVLLPPQVQAMEQQAAQSAGPPPPGISQRGQQQQQPPPQQQGPSPEDQAREDNAKELQMESVAAETRAKMAAADEAELKAQGQALTNALLRKKLSEPSLADAE